MWVWGCCGGWQRDPGAVPEDKAVTTLPQPCPWRDSKLLPASVTCDWFRAFFIPLSRWLSREQRELRAAPQLSAPHCRSRPATQGGRKEVRKERGFTAVPPIPGPGSHSALLCRSAWKANLKPSREFLQAAQSHESHRPLPCSFPLSQSPGKAQPVVFPSTTPPTCGSATQNLTDSRG